MANDAEAVACVIDSDAEGRETLPQSLETHTFEIQVVSDSQTFLKHHRPGRRGCLLVEVSTLSVGGIEFIRQLKLNACPLATIPLAARFTPARVVEAMKAGAIACLESSLADQALPSAVERAIAECETVVDLAALRSLAIQRVATLTARQREVLDLITEGNSSKIIAADLQITQRTV